MTRFGRITRLLFARGYLEPDERNLMDEYKPERKVIAAAVATLVIYVVSLFVTDFDPPVGVEGAIAVVVAYLIPNKA